MNDIYLNPFTDYGFKKLFGEEDSKPYLLRFLNTLLPQEHKITSLEFDNTAQLGKSEHERYAIVDICCKTHNNETIIIELQKTKQKYFKDRTLYYSTFPIARQAEKGNWNYQLNPVYMISILDFTFPEDDNSQQKNDVTHIIYLKNEYNEVFYKKLCFIYVTLPNFKKTEAELDSEQDKWLYLFKNLAKWDESIPKSYQKSDFDAFIEKARVARLSEIERMRYTAGLKNYWDNINTLNTSLEDATAKGLAEGIEKGLAEGIEKGEKQSALAIAKNMKALHLPIDIIVKTTGLSTQEVENLC